MGALAKTDAIDARMLATCARVLRHPPERDRFVDPLGDAELLQQLLAFALRRRQIVQMLTSERQRWRLAHAVAKPILERHTEFFKGELGDSDGGVTARVEKHHAQLAKALASAPGIGAGSEAIRPEG